MTDSEILFRRIKDVAMTKPWRSSRFKDFVKKRSHLNSTEFHHVMGSLGSLKSTDLLGIAVDPKVHREKQNDRDWIIEQLPNAIANLLLYVEHLETNHKQ